MTPASFKALVLEDDAWTAPIMELALKQAASGIEVERVDTVDEAMSRVRRGGYQIIVADVFVRGPQTGVNFWKQCRKSHPEAQVLLTSSMTPEEFRARYADLADDALYLMKPYNVRELTRTLRAMVDYTGYGA